MIPSLPVPVPKTVPLYLESTNDIVPDSPSLKYLQISPENNVGYLNFPEVTFTNLVAVKKKNLGKEITKENFEAKEEYFSHRPNKKSGSIPSNFVYCDGAFSGKLRKISNVSVHEHTNIDEISTILESPELKKSPDSSISGGSVSVVQVSHTRPVDQSLMFDNPEIVVEVDTNDSGPAKKLPPPTSLSCPQIPSSEKPENKPSHPVNPADNPSRHRHSVAGHHTVRQNWAYFQLYGISVGPTGGVFFNPSRNKLLGSSNSLFSTAVISGSCSAPNLRDTILNNSTISGMFCIEF